MLGSFGACVCRITAALAVSTLVSSCIAVGPDYLHPAAPEYAGYARAPLPGTVSAPGPTGGAQHFAYGRDLPEQWWRLYRSPALNRLVEEALRNNQNLQSTMSALRAAKEVVYAQQGRYFPLAQANFNPTRQQTPSSLTPIPASGAQVFDLYTAQLLVSYTLDVWGLNRRTVELQQALADAQRFTVEAAYLTLTSNVVVAAIRRLPCGGRSQRPSSSSPTRPKRSASCASSSTQVRQPASTWPHRRRPWRRV